MTPQEYRELLRLRMEARWAFLDGRNKSAKEFTRRANALLKEVSDRTNDRPFAPTPTEN